MCRKTKAAIILVLVTLLLTGCSKKIWHAQWNDSGTIEQSSGDSTLLLDEAFQIYDMAEDETLVLEAVSAFEKVVEIDSANKSALVYLSNLHILLGTAYSEAKKQKKFHFDQAMKYSELAMYSNPAFRKAMADGKKPWEAAHTLLADDAPAMLFWVTAIQYEFKEVMSFPGKIVNVGWFQRCISFLDRIKEVAPDYGNGAVELAYTICYCALPSYLGGDKEKCFQYMDASVAEGKGYLLPRWARGKYFHQVTGDKDAAIADLQWVARQHKEQYQDAYPWRTHFIEDAAIQISILQQ